MRNMAGSSVIYDTHIKGGRLPIRGKTMPDAWQGTLDTHRIISPEQTPVFAPGEILSEGDVNQRHSRRVFFRNYRFQPSRIAVPGLDSLLVIIYYGEDATLIRRRCARGWKQEHVKPGNMSILAPGRAADWEWPNPINVSHIYLSSKLMADTAASAFERDYKKLDTIELLNIADQKLQGLAEVLAQEMCSFGEEGSRLFVDAVASALSVHLIRRYHRNCGASDAAYDAMRLMPPQRTRALDFINAHISRNFKLAELANVVGLSEFQFLRCFKNTFEKTPHQYVMDLRARLAVEQICRTDLPLAEIAFATGFADQAHMTRAVKKTTGLTPGALRSRP